LNSIRITVWVKDIEPLVTAAWVRVTSASCWKTDGIALAVE